MKNLSPRLTALLAAGAALLAPVRFSSALEPRTWLSIDGRMIEAELVRPLGDSVELRDKDGRVIKVPKSQLSFGDLDYIEENAPEDKTANSLGSKPTTKPKLPNPAKDVKIDTKAFKKEAGDFKINDRTYRVCETPHFKVMYMRPVDPMDVAELAERLWIDTAFFHSTFIPKWVDRKMAIILVNDEEAYEDVGSWFADMISATDSPTAKDSADRIRKTWPRSASGSVQMPQSQADEQKIFSELRVFRAYRQTTQGGKPQPIKGVWVPFNTNVLASDMLQIQAGGVSGATSEGAFAIFTGHAYYKELQLNGRSETSMLGTQGTGKDVTSTGGFQTDKGWAGELRKMIKKEPEWEPAKNLDEVFRLSRNDASTRNVVYAYAFARFLQSTPERLSAFNKLCQKIDVANQVPDLEEIAKIYGYADAAAFRTAWIAWMDSSDFR